MRRVRSWGVIGAGVLAALVSCGEDPLAPTAEDFPDEPAPEPRPEVVAFVDVDVVPMDVERVLRGHTVVVRGDHIEAVGPAGGTPVPAGAFVIEGRGRYLVPGLADMHVHLTSRTFPYLRNDFVLWLAYGVTTTRVMWGSRGIAAERDRVEAGEVLGPALLVASPGIDGPGGTWTASTPAVSDAAEARARVAEHASVGYDFIKVYNDLDRAMYEAVVDEAGARGIPVVGHVPWRVGLERVQDAGQLTLEHLIGIKLQASRPFTAGTLDLGRVRALAARSGASGGWYTPTITVNALSTSEAAAILSSRGLALTSPGMRGFFADGFHNGIPDAAAAVERDNHEVITRAMRDAGARLLVGTDAGFGWMVPGFSIHDELRAFVEAGLSPFEALRSATASAAEAAGRSGTFGRVAVGLRADLLLLARNPLDDLGALEEASGTMVRGRWLSRGTLAAMLAAIEAQYAAEPPTAGPARLTPR